MMMRWKIDANILLIDLETAPNLCFTWGVYDQSVGFDQIVREGYILMYAYQWLGEKKVYLESIHNYPQYKKNPHSDKVLAKKLYDLLDKADIVVAHNGDRFDVKHINTLFLKYIGHPPSAFKTVDTLKQSRINFYQNTHRLDHQCRRHLGQQKVETGGFQLWRDIYLNQCQKAFNKMAKYCKKDVALLHDWYMKILPFVKNHPSVTDNYEDGEIRCDRCGSHNWRKDGIGRDKHTWKRRAHCRNCHRRFRYGPNIKPKYLKDSVVYN